MSFSDIGTIAQNLQGIDQKLGELIEIGEDVQELKEKFDGLDYYVEQLPSYQKQVEKLSKNSGPILTTLALIFVALVLLAFAWNMVIASVLSTTTMRVIYFGLIVFALYFLYNKLKNNINL